MELRRCLRRLEGLCLGRRMSAGVHSSGVLHMSELQRVAASSSGKRGGKGSKKSAAGRKRGVGAKTFARRESNSSNGSASARARPRSAAAAASGGSGRVLYEQAVVEEEIRRMRSQLSALTLHHQVLSCCPE